MNNFDAIPVFVKVVEAGSFSAAARLLNMPKTTVSAKIAALEKRLELKLIQRTTRKLHVTEAGMKYFRHCANAIRELELGEAALQSTQSEPTGLLRVTAAVDIGHVVLPRITQAYLARYPGTSVELLVSNRTVDLIGEGIDLAIRAGTMQDSSLVARRFFDAGTTLFASPTYLGKLGTISHPRNLAKASFVVFKGINKGLGTLRLTNGKSEVEVSMTGRIVADDFETIKALAVLGAGVAWLPDFLAADAVAGGGLVSVLPHWKTKSTGSFSFVYAGRKYTSPKVQAFIQVAQEIVAGRDDDLREATALGRL
jgi:DNA-binding transcriptional LysR family regulator